MIEKTPGEIIRFCRQSVAIPRKKWVSMDFSLLSESYYTARSTTPLLPLSFYKINYLALPFSVTLKCGVPPSLRIEGSNFSEYLEAPNLPNSIFLGLQSVRIFKS